MKPTVTVEPSSDPAFPIRIVFRTAEGAVKDVAEVRAITGKWVKQMQEHVGG